MHPEDKRRFVERAQRALKKHKTFEQLKQRKEQARRKRAERRKDRPDSLDRHDFEELQDGPLFERMRAAPSARAAARRAQASDAPAVEPEGEPDTELETAVVVSVARTRVLLAVAGAELVAALPPGLGLAVGDRVGFVRAAGIASVRALQARTSWLARPDPAHPGREQVLAANVELVVCVVAARAPRWKGGFVDRVLLAAEAGGTRVSLVVNKLDLLGPDERAALAEELAPYRALAEPIVLASTVSGAGLAELRAATAGRTCAFVGPSGVGKSSLLNALDPSHARAVAAVRASDGKGCHTTTASKLVVLANGARLIDTPGIRQLGLARLDGRALAAAFPELRAHAGGCRFRDCSHLAEPGCAVQAALAAGALDARRFASYRRLHAELDAPEGW